jgi:hypothetical protein
MIHTFSSSLSPFGNSLIDAGIICSPDKWQDLFCNWYTARNGTKFLFLNLGFWWGTGGKKVKQNKKTAKVIC